MPITSPGNDDDTGENHQPTLRKNTAEPVEQTLKQNKDFEAECAWLMTVANQRTVSGSLHVSWGTAGAVAHRVAERVKASMPSPFDGLAAIGVDTARATRIRPWSDARTPRASSTAHGNSRNY